MTDRSLPHEGTINRILSLIPETTRTAHVEALAKTIHEANWAAEGPNWTWERGSRLARAEAIILAGNLLILTRNNGVAPDSDMVTRRTTDYVDALGQAAGYSSLRNDTPRRRRKIEVTAAKINHWFSINPEATAPKGVGETQPRACSDYAKVS